MDIRDYPVDSLLTVIILISTDVLILRFWQDLTTAIATGLMMFSWGGLFIAMQIKVGNPGNRMNTRKRMLRTYREKCSGRMVRYTIRQTLMSLNAMPNRLNVHTNNVCT